MTRQLVEFTGREAQQAGRGDHSEARLCQLGDVTLHGTLEPQAFILIVHWRGLELTNLTVKPPDLTLKPEFREQLQGLPLLLTALPASTVNLFGEAELRTEDGKVQALVALSKLHSGEAVEVARF